MTMNGEKSLENLPFSWGVLGKLTHCFQNLSYLLYLQFSRSMLTTEMLAYTDAEALINCMSLIKQTCF
jgi:hypothetical protein